MNRKIVIFIVIFILVLAIAVAVFMTLGRSAVSTKETTNQARSTETASKTTQGSLSSIFAMREGKPQSCVYKAINAKKSAGGTVYMVRGKMRTDFSLSSDTAVIDGHMIVNSDYSYFWTDTATQGIKLPLTPDDDPSITSSSNKVGLNSIIGKLDQEVTSTCSSWTEDDAKFTPPTNIIFADLATLDAISKGSSSGQLDN